MPKKTKYTPIPYGAKDTILDSARAYVQAAVGLDVAYLAAVESGDRETMVNIAALWMRLGELLSGALDDEEEDVADPERAGFTVRTIEKQVILDDGEDSEQGDG